MKALLSAAVFSFLSLIAVGTWNYLSRVDADSSERYGNDLQTLLALNFRLKAEVLKARSGSIGHYDGIVQTEAALLRIHDRLRVLPSFLRGHESDAVAAAALRSKQLFEQTRGLVERFKQENAVLRNSLRYLAVLASQISHPKTPSTQASLHDALDTLVRDELLLQGWHDQSILARVTTEVDQLTAAVAETTHVDRDQLAVAVTHVRLVRERTAAVNALTRSIVEQPAIETAQTIMTTFARFHRQALLQAEQRNTLTFAVALVTVALAAAAVIARLARSARELRQTGDQLARANAALQVEQARQQEINELKSRFVSMTSHEFRTPLSTIMSSSDLLAAYAERWSADKKQEHFDRIRNAVAGMTRMLDGILMIGRSDAGVLEFKPGNTDLVRICARAIEAASSMSRAEHEIIYEGPASSEPVLADESLLRNVLDNLLSNAVKYSPQGGPVTLKLVREGDRVLIDVRDQGIGIPVDDQEFLFETFRRGSNVGSISGSGLGLAVVKRAVQLQGGTLSLQSAPGLGTTFSVQLPCPRLDA